MMSKKMDFKKAIPLLQTYDPTENKLLIDGKEFKGFQEGKAVDFSDDGIKIYTTVANPRLKLLSHPTLVQIVVGYLVLVMLVDNAKINMNGTMAFTNNMEVPNIEATLTGPVRFMTTQED